MKNGILLTAAEDAGFDVLLSGDKAIHHEQNMAGRKVALVYMSANHWPIVKHYVEAISDTLVQVRPDEVRAVYCGQFVARRFKKAEDVP